jgi:hypothetical protein
MNLSSGDSETAMGLNIPVLLLPGGTKLSQGQMLQSIICSSDYMANSPSSLKVKRERKGRVAFILISETARSYFASKLFMNLSVPLVL